MVCKSKVAVMMPVYNAEETLALAISSLLQQTYTYWQCYIVNDGSTDGTKEILDSITDPRFVIIHFEKNRGRSAARQTALEATEGKYLTFLDSDDFFHPDKLKVQVELLEATPNVKLVSCGVGSFDRNYKLRAVRGHYDSEIITYKLGEFYQPSRIASMLYLDLAKKHSYNIDLKAAEDTDFFMRCMNGEKYLSHNDILYFYAEYGFITKKKTITANYYSFLSYKNLKSKSPVFAIKWMSINVFKILTKLLTYPFLSDEFYLNRRGEKPDKTMEDDFEYALKLNLAEMSTIEEIS